MAAASSPADQGVVVDGSPSCKIVPCGDGRHFTFRVEYAAAKELAAGSRLHTSCTIDGVYRCEASFRLQKLRRNLAAFGVIVSGPRYRGVHKVVVDLVLLDNTRLVSLQPPIRSLAIPAATGSNKGGCGLVVSQDYLESNCVQDGIMVALFSVSFVQDLPPCVSSDSLRHRLAAMSGKQDLTDVCFDVDGEKFNAHRLVMAAQSKVFREKLLGSMAESETNSIPVPDMSASTFKHMLHYIYCNELPDAVDDMDESSRIFELRHLLVAADRYGVDTLKELCEHTLCAGIATDTVTSTLELAVARSYPKLRASCIEYLSNTEIFAEVATTSEYCKLIQSYPDVPTEIRNRFKRPRPSPKLDSSTDTKDENNS